uniref:Ubiquitin-like domain-containing protein n=1 Tax=Gouania willdenowi TaxID=441366 RepID=A0A8C5GAW6_GOUWI
MVIQVIVYGYNKERMTVDLCSSEKEMEKLTVLHLKQKIALKMNLTSSESDIVVDMQLIFAGKRLDRNDVTLSSCKLIHQSVIQMVMTMDGGQKT